MKTVEPYEWPDLYERCLAASEMNQNDELSVPMDVDEHGVPFQHLNLTNIPDGTVERELEPAETRYFVVDVSKIQLSNDPWDLVVTLELGERTPDDTGTWLAWILSGKPTESENQGFTSVENPSIMGANG